MMDPQSVSEKLLFSTVKIDVSGPEGVGVGTGFYFNIPYDHENHVPVIVTNKHVVEGAEIGEFLVHRGRKDGSRWLPTRVVERVVIKDFENRWIPHPDPDVDLCCLPIGAIHEAARAANWTPFYLALTDDLIWDDAKLLAELRAVEDVFMFGYPTGLWDAANNLPLVRRGITASHPGIDYCGRPESVIDIASFPGSSGSPVLHVSEGGFVDKHGNLNWGQSRVVLLGALFEGPTWTAEGIVLRKTPTKPRPSETPVMMHLGHIVKAKELRTLGAAVKARLTR